MKLFLLLIALIVSVVLVVLSVKYAPESSGSVVGHAYGSLAKKSPIPVTVTDVTDDTNVIVNPTNPNP